MLRSTFFRTFAGMTENSNGQDKGSSVTLSAKNCVTLSANEMVAFYRKEAEQGNAIAQIIIGSMYDEGRGVEQSDAEAAKWYRMAAEQGNALAQNTLGLMYDAGQGVEQSDTEAASWYRKEAEQGIAAAQNNLGLMYDKGRGVEQSDTEAVKWYRMAAEQGHAAAQANLGDMYKDARGVEQSNFEAVKWYRMAAEKDNKYAASQLKAMHFSLNDEILTKCKPGEQVRDLHFFFGSYPQGKNGEVQPIEWRVIHEEYDRLLVMTEYGLDAKAYNEKRVNTWSDCTLRSWLNGEFMEKAFTDEEQRLITEDRKKHDLDPFCVLLDNSITVKSASNGEKVFLLDERNANLLFSKDQRCCKPTAYALEQGVLVSDNAESTGNCWWWLSSPGLNDSSAASVYSDGSISSDRVTDPTGAVRPAMFLTRSRK